ncbi:Gfo/Idh/MocA family protein [Algoriphagus sp.]|uniref:Gfo/Idh/MocA family protein n=1 Tax=Algoriphagus sp. TaxID=1872435 RepID=UPI003F725DCF
MSKILIRGLGSIGKRHCENLLHLGFRDLVLVSSKPKFPDSWPDLPVYTSVEEACVDHRFTHGIIASPTAYHIEDLIKLLNFDIRHIYLEKPVSHNYELVESIIKKASDKANVKVGFDLHFDPGMMKVKELLDNKEIGEIYSANSFVGQYLPDWRPHEDYRKGMSASTEKGGGVMLDLVHEFDYLCWLLGNPKQVSAIYQRNPELEIDTEDVADVLIGFEKRITGTIHLDYHQKSLIRSCTITGEKGTVLWDLAARTVSVHYKTGARTEFDFSQFERNDRYIAIIDAFMKGYEDERLTSFENGAKSLGLVLAAKKASETSTTIQL